MAWDDTASKIWFDGNMVDWKDANIHVCCPLWYKCF